MLNQKYTKSSTFNILFEATRHCNKAKFWTAMKLWTFIFICRIYKNNKCKVDRCMCGAKVMVFLWFMNLWINFSGKSVSLFAMHANKNVNKRERIDCFYKNYYTRKVFRNKFYSQLYLEAGFTLIIHYYYY